MSFLIAERPEAFAKASARLFLPLIHRILVFPSRTPFSDEIVFDQCMLCSLMRFRVLCGFDGGFVIDFKRYAVHIIFWEVKIVGEVFGPNCFFCGRSTCHVFCVCWGKTDCLLSGIQRLVLIRNDGIGAAALCLFLHARFSKFCLYGTEAGLFSVRASSTEIQGPNDEVVRASQ